MKKGKRENTFQNSQRGEQKPHGGASITGKKTEARMCGKERLLPDDQVRQQ